MSEQLDRLTTALADRYRIERRLGEGGMATVYLAEDLKHDRKVAVKVLRPELAAVLGAERFVQEIKTTASLQHPHILPLFDSGTASVGGEATGAAGQDFLFYVMPYIEGETLRDKLNRETQLGIEEAVRITTEVADALDYAHRQGVIHRDIKPENILLHDGRPMVADFGIALAVSAAAGGRMTETGLSLGTPHYMSPEQATADKDITGRSDVYSLGSVLYEMLTGEPPHTGASAQAIIMKIVTEQAAPVMRLRKSVPPNVAAAIAKTLEKLPADRFDSAKAFAEALANPSFTSAMLPGAGATTVLPSSRPTVLISGLAAGFVLATALAAWGWLRSPPAPPSNRLRISLNDRPIPPGLVGRNLALSRDGRTIVFSDSMDGHRQLWLKTADRADAEPLSGTLNGVAPAFSPDGEWIAFVADGRVRKVPRGGGSTITIADSANPLIPTVAWLENGTIAFNDANWGLRIVGQDGERARGWGAASLGAGVLGVTGLPGGHAVLIAGCSPGCTWSVLMALDLAEGVSHRLTELITGASYVRGHVVFGRPGGRVFAAPFDLGTLEFTSPPIPVLDGVRTSPAAGAELAVALNGTLLFVPGNAVDAAWEAVWVTRDGVATPVDSGWEFVPSIDGGVAMSPDGRRLALGVTASNREDIWIKQLDGGPFTRLTLEGGNGVPTWSADGEFILYSSQGEAGATRAARRRRADGTSGAEVLLHAAKDVNEVLSVPGTERVIVRLGTWGGADVFLGEPGAGDSALSPLLVNPSYDEMSLALSPDGRWLAYASNESGRFEVYVRPFPDVDAGRWQVSRDGGTEPLWAHSGRELFYRSGNGDLIAVTVLAGTSFQAGERRALFSTLGYRVAWVHAQYDITPDDRRFVFVRAIGSEDSGAQPTTAVLVLNWLSDLEPGAPGRQ